jgi:cardiolipin synthase
MATRTLDRKVPEINIPAGERIRVEDPFTRVTGAAPVAGNKIALLRDATENYPRWLAAIEGASKRIFFESYIIHDDKQGQIFSEALISKAKQGVDVKLVYDWMGGLGNTPRRFWRHLRENGVEVRCYNPPNLFDPLAVFSRDHRKTMIVDGEIAFVSGLCVGQDWVGDPDNNVPPWRDTGVELRGPAVAEVEAGFADVWQLMGPPIDPTELTPAAGIGSAGSTEVRVVRSVPGQAHMYRVDQFLAATVTESIWLTDAYFVGVPSYLQGLKDAAADGVDVRVLVPQSTDITLIRDTTRSTYRPLLESGIRVFEWGGTMVHAKTAVFDGRYSRVGSTNLNIASWFGNYEMDVFIDDEAFAEEMESMYLSDLANCTEIVLADTARSKHRPKPIHPSKKKKGGGSVRKATAGALNAATSISSAIAKKTPLGPAEARILFILGIALLLIALSFLFFPRLSSIPLIVILLMLALPTLFKAIKNYRDS